MSIEQLVEASNEIDSALGSYQRARTYYSGHDNSTFAVPAFNEILKGEEDFSGTLNYASIPVDAVADRLQLLSIKGPTKDITDKINEWWGANKMALRFGQFLLDTLTDGENFMTIWPDEADDHELMDLDRPASLLADAPVNHKAKIMFADAATTRAFYDDGGELIYIARKWEQKSAEGELIQRVNLYYDDAIEKYWWPSNQTVDKAEPWYDEGQDVGEWPMDNPYGQVPIFHFSTGFPHGVPEHRSLFGVQDAINKIFQTHIASIEYLGFPIIYTLMDETSATGTADLEYTPIDNVDGSDDVNSLKNNPGEVWAVRAKSIGQIEPAGSTSFIESLKQYKEIASEISGLPARLFSSTDGQHPGADAVNAADAVLRQRVVDRSIMCSESLKQAVAFGLKMAYGIEIEPKDIAILWRPQKIEIDDKVITTFKFKLLLGVPPRRILSEMGYTDTEIDQFIGEGNDGRELVESLIKSAEESNQSFGDVSDTPKSEL